jgi:hypothetical protein
MQQYFHIPVYLYAVHRESFDYYEGILQIRCTLSDIDWKFLTFTTDVHSTRQYNREHTKLTLVTFPRPCLYYVAFNFIEWKPNEMDSLNPAVSLQDCPRKRDLYRRDV